MFCVCVVLLFSMFGVALLCFDYVVPLCVDPSCDVMFAIDC